MLLHPHTWKPQNSHSSEQQTDSKLYSSFQGTIATDESSNYWTTTKMYIKEMV